jgi:hypothetical protein
MVRSLFCAALLALAAEAPRQGFAATDNHGQVPPNWLAGTITADSTLHFAAPGPSYYLYGDLTVAQGATLTVEPGVTLTAAPNSDFFGTGTYPDKVEVTILGNLIAQGTPSQRINIQSTGVANTWGGITVTGSASFSQVTLRDGITNLAITGSVTLTNCTILSGTNGVHSFGTLTIQHCTLSALGSAAIASDAGTLTADDVLLSGVNTAIRAQGQIALSNIQVSTANNGILASNATGYVRTCVLSGGGGNGAGLSTGAGVSTAVPDPSSPVPIVITGFNVGWAASTGAVVQNLLLYQNYYGLLGTTNASAQYCTVVGNNFGSYGTKISNCIIVSNNDFGVQGGGGVDFSDVWANGNNVANNNDRGLHVAAFDPYFESPAYPTFRLAPSSLFTDFGSTGGQIGAYGPGSGPPTSVRGVSPVSGDWRGGAARLVWYTDRLPVLRARMTSVRQG